MQVKLNLIRTKTILADIIKLKVNIEVLKYLLKLIKSL